MEPHLLHVATSEKQRFHLSESVNAWMTSLRHKMDNYCSCCGVNDDHDVINLYQIKSIPAAHNSPLSCIKCFMKTLENNINKYNLISDERVLKRFYRKREIFEEINTRELIKFATAPAARVVLSMKSDLKRERNFKKVHASQLVVELKNKKELLLIDEKELRHLTYLNLDYFYDNKKNTTVHGEYNNYNKNNNKYKATIVQSKCCPCNNISEKSKQTGCSDTDTLELLKMRITFVGDQQLSTEIDLFMNIIDSRALAKQSNTTEQERSAVNEIGVDSYVVSIEIFNALQACFINEIKIKKKNSENIVCVEKEQNNSRISYQENHHHHHHHKNQQQQQHKQQIIREKSVDKKIKIKRNADIKIDIKIINNLNDNNKNIVSFNENQKHQLWRFYNIENIYKNTLLSLGINSLIINYDQYLRKFFDCIPYKNNNYQYLILPRNSDILIKKFQRFHLKYQEQQLKEPPVKLRESSTNEESLINSESFKNNNNKSQKKKEKQQPVCVGVVGRLEKVNSPIITSTASIATFNANDQQVVKQQLEKTTIKLCHTQSTLKLRKFIVVGTCAKATTSAKTTVKSFYNKDISEIKTINRNILKTNTKIYNDTEYQLLNNSQMPENYIKKINFKKANPQHYQLKYKDNKNNNNNNNNNNKINKAKMTIPIANSTNSTHNKSNESLKYIAEEENIYQPIWKFKTVGEAQDTMPEEGDYFRISEGDNDHSLKTELSNDSSLDGEHVDDYGEWETDDEFMFTLGRRSSTAGIMQSGYSTLISTCSNSSNSTSGRSAGGILPLSAGQQSTTFAAALNQSLSYNMFRNIAIFYSLSEPKMRAIRYDYDRIHAWRYFTENAIPYKCMHTAQQSNSDSSENFLKTNLQLPSRSWQSSRNAVITKNEIRRIPKLSDSVQAWKFMLLDINYIDDEEDMIVRENDLMGIREIKDNLNLTPASQNTMSRFKSASIGDLVDLPCDEDKKSIAERMRNKLSRGVFKLNMRSPKNEKKSRGIFRVGQTTSLYLADGAQPKYPIFGVPLEKLELHESTHPNVPRFVVDCIKYIEQKDHIRQEGIYRASGNKLLIDELKKILSESYIYDARLLVTDDIHTLTSLLKQFFRELSTPLIPQEIIEQIGRDLSASNTVPKIRQIFKQMAEPNRSTLKFLIQHLTNVATWSFENRMSASNLAIVWGPCLLSGNQFHLDIGRTNTLAKILIENYSRIFEENERLV